MARLTDILRFVAPELTIIEFPAWDCLPYDRASPHRDILARRIDALTRLAAIPEGERRNLVIVTTVSAILQRVPAPDSFAAAGLIIKRGQSLEQGRLIDYLVGKGYARSGTVGEAGEFAVRGGIVDLFPPERRCRCVSISSVTRSKTCACSIRCRNAAWARSRNSA
jgi:transcription-repair coupling factor (superfamily II helicase)